MIEQKLRDMLRWITPHGLLELSRDVSKDYKYSNLYLKFKEPETLAVLGKNKVLKDIHKNERCFILGTGPSIKKTDIKKLKNEKCIFVSQFYLHQDYASINPMYHIFSGMSPHMNGKATYDQWLSFFKQIEDYVPTETMLFMNYLDKNIITEHGFFNNHTVHYFYYKKTIERVLNEGIDASSVLYGAQGILVMALQLALYMGFKDIYLVGFDACFEEKTLASHFYQKEASIIDSVGVSPEEKLSSLYRLEEECNAFVRFLYELRIFKTFAHNNKRNIYNATNGGVLEVFERRKYEELF